MDFVHLIVHIKHGIVCTEKDLNKTKSPVNVSFTGL
jgi:hypothetical protein